MTGGSAGDVVSVGMEVTYTGTRATPVGFHRAPEQVIELMASPVVSDGLVWILLAILAAIVASLLALLAWRSRQARIEEVFLLHSEGTLLYHVSRSLGGAGDKDKDVLAGILTAIQDFVKESFTYGEKRELNQLEFGDFSVLLERGKHIFIAVVFSGKGESEIRKKTKRTVAEVEDKFGKALEDWGRHMNRVIGARDIVRRILIRR